MDAKAHWEGVYRSKRADDVSWFQPEAATSLALIRRAATEPAASIIDIGGGASRLVDGLVSAGYRHLTVLDLSGAALAESRRRLGHAGADVTWLEGDVLSAELPAGGFDVWHDRALFHFLTDAEDRSRYVAQVRRALKPGGSVIIATFADDGPTRCSGLPVVRYAPETLQGEFGPDFPLIESEREAHGTPAGATQMFVYCRFKRTGQDGHNDSQ